MYHFILSVIFCTLGLCLSAQNIIRGRVLSTDGFPIENVFIRIKGEQQGTVSDSQGFFMLKAELPQKIVISHLNYQTKEVTVNRSTFLKVTLYSSHYRLQEATIVRNLDKRTQEFSLQEISRMPAVLGEKDALKYMTMMPGVVRPSLMESGIYVRGGNSIDNAFLVNDIEIANPAHLSGIMSVFDPWILYHTRFYKSGYPGKYGNYLSSYANMTPSTEIIDQVKAEASIGMITSSFKFRGQNRSRRTSYAVAMRTSYLQLVAQMYNRLNKDNDMPKYSFRDLTAALKTQLSQNLSLTLFGLFSDDVIKMSTHQYGKDKLKWGSLSLNASLACHLKNSLLFWKNGFRSSRNRPDIHEPLQLQLATSRHAFSSECEYKDYRFSKFNWNAGFKFDYSYNDYDKLEPWGLETSHQAIYSLYAEFKYLPTARWMLTGGLNSQYYNAQEHFRRIMPRMQISYRQNSYKLWMDITKTVQYENLWMMLNMKSPADVWYPLTKGMKPAICWQSSFGGEYHPTASLKLYIALYYKNMKNLKDFTSLNFSDKRTIFERQEMGSGKAKGLETEITFHRQSWLLKGSYTLSETWCRFENINDGRRFKPSYHIKHNLLILGNYRFNRHWTFNASWRYNSGIRTTFPVGMAVSQNINTPQQEPILLPVYRERYNYKLPSQHQLDVSAEYSRNVQNCRLKWIFGAYNLYNHQNAALLSFKPEDADRHYTRLVPYSRVIIPCIPYVSFTVTW